MDARTKTQGEVFRVFFLGFVTSWFCFLWIIRTLNPPERDLSVWTTAAFVAAAVYAIVSCLFLRKKYFDLYNALLADDPAKAIQFWKLANILGFCCSSFFTMLGFGLKELGANWMTAGIFFRTSLVLLVLWRPRRLL